MQKKNETRETETKKRMRDLNVPDEITELLNTEFTHFKTDTLKAKIAKLSDENTKLEATHTKLQEELVQLEDEFKQAVNGLSSNSKPNPNRFLNSSPAKPTNQAGNQKMLDVVSKTENGNLPSDNTTPNNSTNNI